MDLASPAVSGTSVYANGLKSVEDITWAQEYNVVKKLRKLGLVETCNIQIILVLRCVKRNSVYAAT